MEQQCIDIGLTRAGLETYLVESGYWGDAEKRRRHAYVLSPSVYQLSPEQELALDRLARKTYAAVERLNNRLVDLATGGAHLSHADARCVKLANIASRSLYTPKDGERRVPPALKVDLVQDPEGNFFIAEVDVYNPRGFGYAALLEDSLPEGWALMRYPGIAAFAALFIREEAPIDWHVVVSEFERYYETSYHMLARAFKKRDVCALRLVRECDLATRHARLSDTRPGVLAIPESMHQHPVVRTTLLDAYREGGLEALYPPVAYLGSKAFLPFLRSCEGMEEFITPTTLVERRYESALRPGAPAVLKASVSSGMKGVYFSDMDEAEFNSALEKARELRNPSWILQEQVPQEPIPITVFGEEGERVEKGYYLRITAYIGKDGVFDAEVTGRTDRKVHGAPDCIMIPIILTRDMR